MKKLVVIGTGRMGGAFATAFAKRTSQAVSIPRGSHAGFGKINASGERNYGCHQPRRQRSSSSELAA